MIPSQFRILFFFAEFFPKDNMIHIYILYFLIMKIVHFNHIYVQQIEHYQLINV